MKRLLFLNYFFLSMFINSFLSANFSYFKENMQLAAALQQKNGAVEQQSRFQSRISTKLNSISSNPIYNQQLFKKLVANALDRPRAEKKQLSFDDLPLDVRKIILNEYQKMGVKITPHWDPNNQTLIIQTFAPFNTKTRKTSVITKNDYLASILNVSKGVEDDLYTIKFHLDTLFKSNLLLTKEQFNHMKDVHYTVWKNKPFHSSLFGIPVVERKKELNECPMNMCKVDIKSIARLEKTDKLFLIEFNPDFVYKDNRTGTITAENTKQLAIYDKISNKTTYLGCPDPSWKNFTVEHSVSVQPNYATNVFRKTMQEIAEKNSKK